MATRVYSCGRVMPTPSPLRSRGYLRNPTDEPGSGQPGPSGCGSVLAPNKWSNGQLTPTTTWPTHPSQGTVIIPLRPVEPTRIHHPQMTERKVVTNRVLRVEGTDCSAKAVEAARKAGRELGASETRCPLRDEESDDRGFD